MSDENRPRAFSPLDRNPVDFETPRPSLLQRLLAALVVAPPTIPVVDISHWNYPVNFAQLRESGIRGGILKCSEGTTIKDDKFEMYWQAALKEDLAVMVYHFFRDKDGAAEFDWFMQCAANFLEAVQGKAAVALDVETNNGVTQGVRASRAFQFCGLAKSAGLLDGVYSSPALVSSLFPAGETRWSNLAFQWVAHWTSAATYTLPPGWSASLVKFWQKGIYPTYSWIPPVLGDGTIDYNLGYFPDEPAFKTWLGQVTVPAIPKVVRVLISNGTLVRTAPKSGKYLRIEPLGALVGVQGYAEDVDGLVWYDTGAGYVRSDQAEVIG